MISLRTFRPSDPSPFSSFNMRALVLLCLLHVGHTQYGWNGPDIVLSPELYPKDACLQDQASCGCCLMREQMQRMEWFFNYTYEEMSKELEYTKLNLDHMRGSRSAFSVALNQNNNLKCLGPFDDDQIIMYQHVYLNLDDSYNIQSGIFTVPRAGVYSLSVTIYASSTETLAACANLEVNGKVVSELLENNGQDLEDSATVVVAIQLEAGDAVYVLLPKTCVLCDEKSNRNTFTGFLLYATD